MVVIGLSPLVGNAACLGVATWKHRPRDFAARHGLPLESERAMLSRKQSGRSVSAGWMLPDRADHAKSCASVAAEKVCTRALFNAVSAGHAGEHKVVCALTSMPAVAAWMVHKKT